MNNETVCTSIISDNDIPNIYLIKKTLKKEISNINITEKTLDFEFNNRVSIFFKMILGNYLECINNGYDNTFYRYDSKIRYYYKLHKNILSSMGYNCNIYELNFNNLRKFNSKLNIFSYLYFLLISRLMRLLLNKQNIYIRNNIGFEINKGSFDRIKKTMINKFLESKGFIDLIKKYIHYKNRFKSVFIDKPKNCLKVAIIGDLFSSYFIENQLANKNVEVYQINKKSNIKAYDGVIYIRDFYNSSEMKFLKNYSDICSSQKKPLMYLNIDEKITEDNIKSKLDVFYDMITIKAY